MALKIIIIGGGIGGLALAIGLRRHGHHVKILERSAFANEVGAAANIPPNAMKVLNYLGVPDKDLHGCECYALRLHSEHGTKFLIDTGLNEQKIGYKATWLLTHRQDLHSALYRAASATDAPGSTPEIKLSSKVVAVNHEKGQVTLDNGTIEEADLIVGADGINSVAVQSLIGAESPLVSTDQNCFRFLVPVKKVIEDPKTRSYMTRVGVNTVDSLTDPSGTKKIVIYPCRDGTLINVGYLHPASETGTRYDSGWLSPGKIEDLLRISDGFDEQTKLFLTKAEDIKLWGLATRDPPKDGFYKNKLVLLGDAAHHALPHYGQGAAIALEDAAALAILIDDTTTPENLRSRLEAYNRMRSLRGLTLSIIGRVDYHRRHTMLPKLREYIPDAEAADDMMLWFWDYDVIMEASKELESLKGKDMTSSLLSSRLT